MKKHFFWRFSLIVSLLFAGYWAVTYANLKNPMSEMMYSETSDFNLMGYRSLGEVIGDEKILENNTFSLLKDNPDFQSARYSDNLIKIDAELIVTVFRDTNLLFMYHVNLEDDAYVGMIFDYDLENNSFIQNELYLHKNDIDYENQALIDELSAYGKDLNWLRNQSRKVVEDYILGTWFEHGSDRYSLDNLGNLTIEYHELLTEE